MRLSILVYGVLYVVLEMVGHQLATVGWGRVTPLHVASALVDALLAIVVAIAAVVLYDVGRRRWGPALRAWQARQIAAAEHSGESIGVPSWRPESTPFTRAIGAPAAPRTSTYGTPGAGRRFPEEPGRLL
jgi:hypothetical protein